MSHTITWEPNGLLRKFSGTIKPDEILESNFEIHSQPKFKKITYIINDFTEVNRGLINTSHTKIYASTDDIISSTKGNLNIAIVINQESQSKLANNYRKEMKNEFFKCEIFQTIDDARTWVES